MRVLRNALSYVLAVLIILFIGHEEGRYYRERDWRHDS